MDYGHIKAQSKDGVVTITLNRPDRLNAWTGQMDNELRHAIVMAGSDKDARCIVITGEGRGFCAGADMDGLQQITPGDEGSPSDSELDVTEAPSALRTKYPGRFGYFYASPLPIIAKINGPCAGIGMVMSLFADMRFAADNAKFTTAFAQRGLIAEHGISWVLPRLIGEAQALDLLLTARKFLGSEAAEIGLVNASMPLADLHTHVDGVAAHIATQVSPRSTAIMKRQIRDAYTQSFGEALEIADEEMKTSFGTFDFKEGVASFVERRAPAFQGN